MPVDGAFWRSLRQDFESLRGHQFGLMWDSSPPLSFGGEPLDSHWSWFRFPDDSLRARLSAIALRGARALGYDLEDAWYDLLRTSAFVRFQLSGSSRQRRSDGVMVDWDWGEIRDVEKESITLCFELEVETLSPPPLPTAQPESLALSLIRKDSANVAQLESTSAAVRIMQAAMQQTGLNPVGLAVKIQAILRRAGPTKAKADRTTVYRIVGGKTKKPQPAIRNALIKALQLQGEDAAIVLRELSGAPRSIPEIV